MHLVYNGKMGGSNANAPEIPNKAGYWPDQRLRATPPPAPQKPLLSLVYPMIPRRSGPASVA